MESRRENLLREICQLIKDSATYGFSKAILLPLGLITLPIFTRIFIPAEYGVIELIGTITSLLAMFLVLGINSAAQRSYFDFPNHKDRVVVISTGLWFLVIWSLLVVGIILPCSKWISSLAFGTGQNTDLLRIAFITIPISLLVTYCQDTIRLHFSPWKFTIVALSNGILTTGLSILLVLTFKMGLIGFFFGVLAGSAISLLPALYFIKTDLTFTFSSTRIKEMLSYGAPLVSTNLAYYIIFMSDRLFLAKLSTMDAVGLYSAAIRISSIMLFFNTAFGLAWTPIALKLYSESEDKLKKLTNKVLKYLLVLFSLLAVFFTVFSREFLYVFSTELYFGAAIAIAPLCLGAVAFSTTQVTALGISLSRKTKFIGLFSWIAAVTNLGLNVVMVPRWGILGASIASAISLTILTLCYYVISQKLYPTSFDKMAILKICLICLVFVVGGSLIVFDSIVLGLFVKFILILFFIAALFLFKVFDSQEIAYIRRWLLELRKIRSISSLKALVHDQTGGKRS